MIDALRRLKAGQRVRDDGPQRHLQKEGTPTMGGVMIVGTMLVGMAIGAAVSGPGPRRGLLALLLAAATTVAFAAIGFADDYLKIRRGRSLGLKARQKLLFQFVAAGLAVYLFAWLRHSWPSPDDAWLPAQGRYVWWMLLWVFALVGVSNAMNMADGLDGLATGLCVVAAAGFAVLGAAERSAPAAVTALAVAGACLGFLWFNRHPARVFMGDVGSLALGAAMGMMALLLTAGRSLHMVEPVLALAGLCLVPFVEAASVVIQVISFQSTGKRVFKMSPIHHHFELSGWSERRVVWTFWAVAAVVTVATVSLMPVRVK
jgi:phospho-N-acetylmuramoyl-pentapeptide-transferase